MPLKPRIHSELVLRTMAEVSQLKDFKAATNRLRDGGRPPKGFWEEVSERLPESERKNNVALSNWWARVKDETLSVFLHLCEMPEQPYDVYEPELASAGVCVKSEELTQEPGEYVEIAYQGNPPEVSGPQEEEPSSPFDTSKASGEQDIPSRFMDVLRPMIQRVVDDYQKDQRVQIDVQLKELTERIEEVAKLVTGPQKLPNSQNDDLRMPPKPKRKKVTDKDGNEAETRAFLKPRESLQGTVDAALHKLFEQDREARGLGVSQMLDFLLFNFYGRPKLSFETQSDD